MKWCVQEPKLPTRHRFKPLVNYCPGEGLPAYICCKIILLKTPVLLGLLTWIFAVFASPLQAQNSRSNEYNQIGWYGLFMNFRLDDKWSVHAETQIRRTDWVASPQQNLYRVGINFKFHPQVTFRTGYAFADTFNYGEQPIQSNGIRFPEHRLYQMLLISNPLGKVGLSHRLMLEQRWVGRSTDPKATKYDEWVYFNRMRYMIRADVPLKGPSLENKEPYLAVYDEILIGFGKKINQNVFDQNRFAMVGGFRFSGNYRLEAGYFSQILQFGRLVDGKNHFQYNRGIVFSNFVNF